MPTAAGVNNPESQPVDPDLAALILLVCWCTISVGILLFAVASGLTTYRLRKRLEKIDGTEEKDPQTIILENYDISLLSLIIIAVATLLAIPTTRPIVFSTTTLVIVGASTVLLICWGAVRRTVWKDRFGPSS
jgi:hypothetical protein